MTSVLSLSEELLQRPSITPNDAGCIDLLGARLEKLGFVLERFDANGVSNLWARRGKESPLCCFAGHTDVVPTGPREAWQSDPFQPAIRDGMLYGRGAADMKSSLAASVVAIERFVTAQPQHQGSIAVLLTSDEEGDAIDGTQRVVDALSARGGRIDYCIVAEPTSEKHFGDTIKNGRRGSLSARLLVRGIQGHVAYPQLARNPLHLVLPALTEMIQTRWDEGNADFPPTSFQISNAHGGTGAGNVIPGTFEVRFNFRFATASTPQELQERVHGILDRYDFEYQLSWETSQTYLSPNAKLIAALTESIQASTGVTARLSTSGGTSDGRFIADICAEVAEFGPINASIHKVDECIAVADLEPLARCYEGVLQRLLATPVSLP